MKYAMIENGVVTNMIVLHPMNESDFPNAVCADGYSVAVGDAYTDGVFYRDGEAIRLDTEIAAEEKADMVAALNNLGVYADE